MTKPVTENEKPTRKRKKASKEPKSAEQEPKKKFPHSTSRNRRQVNKELLLMPDDEIDRRRLSIKDLIRTYEAKERISSKESAAQANSSSNQSHKSFPYDTHHGTDNGWGSDDDAENDNVQLNGTTVKWNHHSFRKNPSSTSRWSKSETELFYQALRQFGTNFEMIQKLFPGRTRHQMTLKFKNERRKFPLQVADATSHPSTDFSLVKLVMEKIAEEEKEKAKEKVFYVQEEGENEDENGQTEKEEQEGNDWEGGLDSSVKPDDYEGVAYSPNQLNEYDDNLEWDGEKNEYDDFFDDP